MGYVYEMCFVSIVAETYFLVNGAFLILFVSICLTHRAFQRAFESAIEKLGNADDDKNDKQLLSELVQFHASFTEFVDLFL